MEVPEQLGISHIMNYLLPEKKKKKERKKKINKQKLICNLNDKEKYVVLIRNFKQILNHGLKLEKVHRGIKFNQNDSLKGYTDLNAKKNNDFGQTMENVRKLRSSELVTNDKRRNYLNKITVQQNGSQKD